METIIIIVLIAWGAWLLGQEFEKINEKLDKFCKERDIDVEGN